MERTQGKCVLTIMFNACVLRGLSNPCHWWTCSFLNAFLHIHDITEIEVHMYTCTCKKACHKFELIILIYLAHEDMISPEIL